MGRDDGVAGEAAEYVDKEAAAGIVESSPVPGRSRLDIEVVVDDGRGGVGGFRFRGRHEGKEQDGMGGREVERLKYVACRKRRLLTRHRRHV